MPTIQLKTVTLRQCTMTITVTAVREILGNSVGENLQILKKRVLIYVQIIICLIFLKEYQIHCTVTTL